jgi:hypothetical protein
VELWKKAFADCDHELAIEKLFGKDGLVTKHVKSIPHLDAHEIAFNPEYTYARCEVLG